METELIIGTSTLKILYTVLVSWVAGLLAFLNIDADLMFLYAMLLTLDLITGTFASFMLRKKFSKARFGAGILAKVLMILIPVTIGIVSKMQGVNGLIWFTKWTLIVLGISEALSIFNNILKAQGKPTLPDVDAISIIATRLREILEKLIKKGEN